MKWIILILKSGFKVSASNNVYEINIIMSFKKFKKYKIMYALNTSTLNSNHKIDIINEIEKGSYSSLLAGSFNKQL